MEQILLQVLNDASTVILPHFGAIIKLGETFQFNEFLKYNDGKLIKAVAEAKKVDEEQATILVSDFIREIKEHLNANKDYNLGKIGFLTKKGEKVVLSKSVDTVVEKQKPTIQQKTPSIDVPAQQQETIKKEVKPIIKNTEEVTKKEAPQKEVNPKINTSSNLVIDVAIEKIKKIKNLDELAKFTAGEKRESVLKVVELVKKSLSQSTEAAVEKVVSSASGTKEVLSPDKESSIKETLKAPNEIEKKETKSTIEKKKEVKQEEAQNSTETKTKKTLVVETKKKEEPVITEPKKKTPKEAPKETIDPKIEKELMEGAIVIEQEAKKRKRNKIILWVAIIFLLLGTSILGFLKKESIKGLFGGNNKELAEHKTIEDKPHKSDNTSHPKEEHVEDHNSENETDHEEKEQAEEIVNKEVEEVVKEEVTGIAEKEEKAEEHIIDEEPEQEIEEPEAVTNGRYNIVVGSFSKEENASNLVQTLKEKGYSNARVLSKSGSLYPVSIGNYSSRSEAKTALKEIKDAGYKGWIKKI